MLVEERNEMDFGLRLEPWRAIERLCEFEPQWRSLDQALAIVEERDLAELQRRGPFVQNSCTRAASPAHQPALTTKGQPGLRQPTHRGKVRRVRQRRANDSRAGIVSIHEGLSDRWWWLGSHARDEPMKAISKLDIGALLVLTLLAPTLPANEQDEDDVPIHLRDRGSGVPTSMFGTYVRERELLAYSFVAYSGDNDIQYDPNEFGFAADKEFLGRYRAREADIWLAYGLRDNLALELQVAATRASLQRAQDDTTGLPVELKESGLGNVRARLDWRLFNESGRRPEIYTFATLLVPHDKNKALVGTENWLLNLGIGAIRGYRWGTLTLRSSMEFDLSSASVGDWGEVTLEYLKWLSPALSVDAALELLQGDEGSVRAELQWRPAPRVIVKLGGAQALTASGLDWSAQAGVLVTFRE
jgi:hypothetical protein